MEIILKLFSALLFLIFFQSATAQPHIEGNVEIDMRTGLIKCEFSLSELPKLATFRILLNKGMNIKCFHDHNNNVIAYDGYYDGKLKGEAIEYQFRNLGDSLPPRLKVSYQGAFPVYVDEYNSFDFKGVIAINEQTMRASEQTKWYPVIYDVENDRIINSYSYKLDIKITNGNTIFINGSPPKKGSQINFESKSPFPLLLFAGTYDFIESNGDYILNSNINEEVAERVFENIEIIKVKLSNSLDKSFKGNIYLINHKAINKRKTGSSWGFNTYPAFAFTGLDFNKLVDDTGKFSNNHYKYFGHEFAHNYFGNNVMSGKLTWFWLESFPEYLSYTIVNDICGQDILTKVLHNELKNLKGEKFLRLDEISHKSEIGQKYRYDLGPLLVQCFEDEFGRETTFNVIKQILLRAETETLTLKQWENACIISGISEKQFERFKAHFISNSNFKKNIIKAIQKKHRIPE